MKTDIIVAVIAIVLLLFVSVYKKTLTIPGAILASAMMLCISICASYKEVIFLMLSYILIVIIDLIFKDKAEKKVSDVHKKTGTRGVVQILANGSCAVLATVFLTLTNDKAFLYTYMICVSEACADSIASDVGVLSKRKPRSILTFKTVETGMSGGISLLGMLSSLAGCVIMAVLACISLGFTYKNMIFMVVIAYLGMITDSVIGAGLQAKFRCSVCGKATEKDMHCDKKTEHIGGIRYLDNSMVNIITNIITGVIAYFAAKQVL